MHAWQTVVAFAVALVLIWEARELVRVRVVHVPASELVRMAEAGTLTNVRVAGGAILAEARASAAHARVGVRARIVLGLPPDGQLLVADAGAPEARAFVTAALAAHVPVREVF